MEGVYSFKPGEWIMVEDDFARVESVFAMHCEAYDIDDEDDVKEGDYEWTVVSYHSFCNIRGRVNSSKAQIKYVDFCDWIRPLTGEERNLLERIKAKKAKAFEAWDAKCKAAKDYVQIYVGTDKGYGEVALSKFRKAARTLPERFTFADVQAKLASVPEIKANTASTVECSEDYIYFELCYFPKEQKGGHLSFYKIREFGSRIDMSTFINFEMVFISLYQLVRLCGVENNSEELNVLADRLKKAALALSNEDAKSDALAKDFFKKAPRIFYTFDTAYSTMAAFLERNSKELGAGDLVELVKNRDEKIVELYHRVLGI